MDYTSKQKNFLVTIAESTVGTVKKIIEDSKPVIAKEPLKSVLCLTDAADLKTSPENTLLIKDLTHIMNRI